MLGILRVCRVVGLTLSILFPPFLIPFLRSLSFYISDYPYKYTSQLLGMEACSAGRVAQLPDYPRQIITPLKLERWQELLSGHPDKEFTEYILRGIKHGFRVGFNVAVSQLKSQRSNMVSAAEHPDIVSYYLKEEMRKGRVIKVGSLQEAESLRVHCSPFGVIPKRNSPSKWRLILDLSSPAHHSTNDGIDKDLASLSYISVGDAVAVVLQLGRGALMAKMDIKIMYQYIHATDCYSHTCQPSRFYRDYPAKRALMPVSWHEVQNSLFTRARALAVPLPQPSIAYARIYTPGARYA